MKTENEMVKDLMSKYGLTKKDLFSFCICAVNFLEYYLNNFDKGWEMKVYDNIDWMQLESAYYGNEWNWAYNTSNNPHLSNDIKNVFNKYCSSK